jgi:hypothetical protein
MTSDDWNALDRPGDMLDALFGLAYHTRPVGAKFRQFACVCCRLVESLLIDPRSREAVAVAELFADRRGSPKSLARAHEEANKALWAIGAANKPLRLAAQAACWASFPSGGEADIVGVARTPYRLVLAIQGEAGASLYPRLPPDEEILARPSAALRELFGDPFDPVAIDPAWLVRESGAVSRLAAAIRQDGDFARMPILGDALEEVGCQDERLLRHCRAGGHLPGCWLVDAILAAGL